MKVLPDVVEVRLPGGAAVWRFKLEELEARLSELQVPHAEAHVVVWSGEGATAERVTQAMLMARRAGFSHVELGSGEQP
jgi:hypothetical protein